MKRTYAIIVTYNPDVTVLREQIVSLSSIAGLVIIDNFSSNLNEIESLFVDLALEDMDFVKNPSNFGLAFAQNQGIGRARLCGAEHIIIFDQDSIPAPGMITHLLNAELRLIAQGERVGAIGPITFDPDSGSEYPITRYNGPFIQRYYPRPGELANASFIIASGSLIRMSVIDDVGGMLDSLFIDYIDVEWCYRAQSLGYRLFISSAARMSHRVGDKRVKFFGRSISQHSPLRRYYLTRNSLYVLRLRHIPMGYKIRELSLNLARFAAFLYFSNERGVYLRYVARAVSDGLRGKFGKLEGM